MGDHKDTVKLQRVDGLMTDGTSASERLEGFQRNDRHTTAGVFRGIASSIRRTRYETRCFLRSLERQNLNSLELTRQN